MTRLGKLATSVVLGAAGLLLTPATGAAQGYMGGPYSGYPVQRSLSWPSAYSYTARYYWHGYNWPYPGYWVGTYEAPPYFPTGASSSGSSGSSSDRSSYYSYGATSSPESESARLKMVLPDASAEVWVEGQATKQRGTTRGFVSPALDADKSYAYEVKARWTVNGRPVEQTREVTVRAGVTVTVDFTAP
jgi:uncharacterized protein (TIGR03000 family)